MSSPSSGNRLAYQANALVRASLKLTHTEARIFALALGCIHQGQTELPAILIPLERVLTQKKGGSAYETIREACKGLVSKIVTIEATAGTKKRFTAYSIISYLDLNQGTGLLTGNFAPEIKPFLLHLAEHFTRVEIETLLTLRSAHAHRLYWLLKSWDSVGEWEVAFGTLRRLMLGDENDVTYPLFYDFKRYVLAPAVEELQAVGWNVTYEPLKPGKKVEKIRFTIPTSITTAATASTLALPASANKAEQQDPVEQITQPAGTGTASLVDRVATRLQKLKLTPSQIKQVVTTLGEEKTALVKLMKVTHPLLRDHEAGNKVFENLGGVTVNLLKTEFPSLYPASKA